MAEDIATTGRAPLVFPDGAVQTVPLDQVERAKAELGARDATDVEYFGAQTGTGGDVAAGALGAARGMTFGLSDNAYVEGARLFGGDETADETRELLRLYKAASPSASFAGELAGAVAPAIATGGATLGATAGRGARVALGAGEGLGFGAAAGAGAQLTEDTLENHALVGEAYLSASLKGGAVGLLLGGAGAGLGTLFGRGGKAAEKVAGGTEREALPVVERAAAAEDAAAPAGRKTILGRVEGLRDELTYNATGATAKDVHKLGANAAEQAAEQQRLGRVLREHVDVTAAQGEIDRQIAAKQKEAGSALAAMYKEADAAAQRPSVDALDEGMAAIRAKYGGVDPASVPTWAEFQKEAMPRLMKVHGGHNKAYGDAISKEYAALRAPTAMFANEQLAAAERAFSELKTVLGKNPTHEKLWEASKAIGERLNFTNVESVALGKKALRDLYEVTRGELRASVDRASAELGGTIGDRIRSTNQLYSDLKTLGETSARAAKRGSGDTFTRGDVWLGGAAALSGQPAAVAAVGLNVARRKYGNQVAAHVLNDVVHMQSFQRATAKLDEMIDAGARAFVSNSKAASRAPKPITTAEVRSLREATRTPDAVTARVTERLGDMPRVAPKIAQQIALTAARAAAWLQRTLPREQAPATPMFGKPREIPLSDEQLLEARAAIETVEDGSIVIDRLRQNRLTQAHVATLKFVYPETYNKVRNYLAQHATELNKALTQQQLTQLSMLFGEPLSEADLPENVRAFQASFVQGNQAPGAGGAGGNTGMAAMGGGPVRGGGSRATATDKLEAGAR